MPTKKILDNIFIKEEAKVKGNDFYQSTVSGARTPTNYQYHRQKSTGCHYSQFIEEKDKANEGKQSLYKKVNENLTKSTCLDGK